MDLEEELIIPYTPYIYFDRNEPFFPLQIGWTVFDRPGKSPSFPREIRFDTGSVRRVIEYAVFWDFDIGHLYDLEHIWVYVGYQGKVVDCEASFHGKYLKGLLKTRCNLEDKTHVRLYSQPGKHAFSPLRQVFELLPGYRTATDEGAGRDGLCVTGVARGRYETNDTIDRMIETYMQRYRFRPAGKYEKYMIPDSLLVPWPKLDALIPARIETKLEEMRSLNN